VYVCGARGASGGGRGWGSVWRRRAAAHAGSPPLRQRISVSLSRFHSPAIHYHHHHHPPNTHNNNSACCVYALSTNPSAQRRLCAEVDAFFAEHGRGAELTPEAVARNFPFAEGAVKEALRLYSPVTAIAREVAPLPDNPHEFRSDLLHGGGDDGLGNTTNPPSLRPGITIAAANYVYQHSSEYWPRADQFLPERWVPEERGGAASVLGATTPAAWTPFGGGPRQCVGIKFAMLEAVIALARLLERYTFEPAPSQKHPLPLKQALTLSPDGGVNVIVKRRAEYYPGDAAVAA
jgi:cytochrome P450